MNCAQKRVSILVTLCLLWFYGTSYAQTVTSLQDTGNSSKRVDLVIVGDGYTSSELGKFATDVNQYLNMMWAQQPFQEYRNYFNVRRIDVASAESGADHSDRIPQVFRNTAFDAAYNCGNVQRLICVNVSKVLTAVSVLAPSQRDIILLIVNDPEYGGSGGTVAVASTNVLAAEITFHELGHSFASLADEYTAQPPTCSDSVEPTAANATKETNRALIKWGSWINPSTPVPTSGTTLGVPGLYLGSAYCPITLYRPTFDSKMRSLGRPYDQINTEQFVKRFYQFASPIDTFEPASTTLSYGQGNVQQFSVTTPQPATHSLDITWQLDGQPAGTGPSFTLNSALLAVGNHSITVTVIDTTVTVRNDPQSLLRQQVTWSVDVTSENPPALTVSKTGTGNGTVTSVPAGINCGTACSTSFPSAQIVALISTPLAGSIFAGWSGDADCIDGSVTMTGARNCIARFTKPPVAVDDSFRVDKGGTLNVPAPGVLANDTDADGNPLTAVQMTSPIHGSVVLNADGSFSYVHNGSDAISDSFTYKTNDGLADSTFATVTVAIDGLFVNLFQPTSIGFVAKFSRPIDATVLSLYSTEAGGLGPPDVTLVGVGGGTIRGSVVVSEAGGTVTFIRTGGVLPPDTYTATLHSATNGFKSSSVGLLDGNHDGTAGDDYSATFTVASSSAVVVSVPDFLRGPGQPVDLFGTGIPLTLSSGANVSYVNLVLNVNPDMLLLSTVVPGAGLPPGSTIQADFSAPDQVYIFVAASLPLSVGGVELVRISGQVPLTAPYGASQILAITDLSLNSGDIPAIGDDGLHVAAFIGDTTGNGGYSSLDAQHILRVAAGLDSGFAAFLKIDPVVVADITANGVLSSLDATRLLQEIVGIDRPEIPPLP